MQIYSDSDVNASITMDDAISVMRDAFIDFAAGNAAVQARQRCGAREVGVSTMSAVLPRAGMAGAKVYTTVRGKFTFVTILFSVEDGRVLAVVEGDALTRFRTAATTAVAADRLATPSAETLAIFGTGVQARAHVEALLRVRPIKKVYVVGIEKLQEFADEIQSRYRVSAEVAQAEEALRDADIVVTATRATNPLFAGELIKPGAFVAAIGSSKPTTREIDDSALRRAGLVVVEWKSQAVTEAGDLVLADSGAFDWGEVCELGQVLAPSWRDSRPPQAITVYKAVGIGLADTALGAFLYDKTNAQLAGKHVMSHPVDKRTA